MNVCLEEHARPADSAPAPNPHPTPPPRPSPAEERWSLRLFSALAPRLAEVDLSDPPDRLRPWRAVSIPRPDRGGHLGGTWYPTADAAPRGAVLLAPPWLEWGQTYFHRRRRIETLRAAGYHALTMDFPGFGDSSPAAGFFDRDIADALAELARRAPGLPLFLWGVSSGGYWSHMALSRDAGRGVTGGRGVQAAVFEDVSPHLIEWSSHTSPLGRPFHLLFRRLFRNAFAYMDLRRHAPALAMPVAYVSGADDTGVPAADTRELARRADGEVVIVPGAGHLQPIKRDTGRILDLALRTFEAGG